jgi:hypothetical protein
MRQYSSDLQKLATESGVNVKRTPDSVMKAQLDAWDKILPPLMADAFFKKVVDSQKAWCEQVVYYTLLNNAGLQDGVPALLTRTRSDSSRPVDDGRGGRFPPFAGRPVPREASATPHGALHPVCRHGVGMVRQGVCLVRGLMTLGIGYEVVARYFFHAPDALGVRFRLHDVRHACS